MLNFKFMKTDDNSVGLFNNDINDIYHSIFGAKTESYQKFIQPSGILNFAKENNRVKILDLCYGIGYNTKSALLYLKKINANIKIEIDALELDKNTILFSPFIFDAIDDKELNIFLLENIFQSDFFELDNIYKILSDAYNENSNNFNELSGHFLKNCQFKRYKLSSLGDKLAFLHNIYYQYVSNSTKNAIKSNIYDNCAFNVYIDDARNTTQSLDSKYDFVFLDAFTSEKDPTLWTIDFLAAVRNLMSDASVLVTYSISAAFRSELLELGFCVGKILKGENQIGTIASFDKNKIQNQLNDFELNLIKTNAGIFYRDEKLNSSKEEILSLRKLELKNSNRISTTKFLKSCSSF